MKLFNNYDDLILVCLNQMIDLQQRKKRGIRSLYSKVGLMVIEEHSNNFNTLKLLGLSSETWKHLKNKYINDICFNSQSLAPWCYSPTETEKQRLQAIDILFDSLSSNE